MKVHGLCLIFLACAVGCSRSPQFTEAEVAAASDQSEKLMSEYAVKKDPADVDRILDSSRIAMFGKEKIGRSAKMPLLGFMHGVFAANPDKAAGWTARKSEFKGTVLAEVLAEAGDFDEKRLLDEECEPGTLDYCWGAFCATGEIRYPQKVIDVALASGPANAVDIVQMAAVWSLHDMALRYPAVAKALNESLRDASDDAVKRVAERFDAEDEREKVFDAGVRMRMGLASPSERRSKPPQPVGRWQGLDKADDWIANVRTNRTIETCGRFRDERFVPFFVAEVLPAGETNEQFRAMAADCASCMFDNDSVTYMLSTAEEAKSLVEAGCDVPFVKWLAATLKGADMLKELDTIRLAGTDDPKTAMDVLVAYSRWKFEPSVTNRMNMLGRIVEWADARGFRDVQARCALLLIGYVAGQENFKLMSEMLAQSKRLDPWVSRILAAVSAKDAAWKARGGGWASSVSEDGWRGFRNNSIGAHDLFAEARRLHPDFTEGSYAEAQTHGGDVEWLDSLFSRMTDRRLDEYSLYSAYAFFALYPRWGGSTAKMERFADICYATGRHDTMITAMYAKLQIEIAYEKGVPIGDYFADRKRLDRFLEVCDAQITNANAYAYVRNQAFFERAFVLGRLGRYGEIGDFAAGRRNRKTPTGPGWLAQSIVGDELELCGLTGPNGKRLAAAHELYRQGKWNECLAAYRDAKSLSGLTVDEMQYLKVYEKSAALQVKGGTTPNEVSASYEDSFEFYTETSYWKICPQAFLWCRRSKGVKPCPLQWCVPLPREHAVCFSLEPLTREGEAPRGHVKVEPRFSGDILCRGLACMVIFDGAQVGVGLVNYDLNSEQSKEHLKWLPYSGGRVPVKIAWSAGKVSVWAGDAKEPVASAGIADSPSLCGRPPMSARLPVPVRETFVGWKIKIHELKALAGQGFACK